MKTPLEKKKAAFFNFNLAGLFLFGCLFIFPSFGNGPLSGPLSGAGAVVGRARFLAENGFRQSWFPAWYLGTPGMMLGSPLVPSLLAAVHLLRPAVSFWLAYRILVGLAIAFLPVSAAWLAFTLSRKKTRVETGLVTGILMLIVPGFVFVFPALWPVGRDFGFWPWPVVSGLFLGNGSRLVGLAFVFWFLGWAYRWFQGSRKAYFAAVGTGCLALLAEVSVLPTLLVGLSLEVVAFWVSGRTSKRYVRQFLWLVLTILGGLAFIYPLRFWWLRLSAPSLAGKRTLAVGLFATRFLSLVIPFVLAFGAVRFSQKKRSFGQVFSLLWWLVFGLLTLGRWLADVDFWQDYTAWGTEVSLGLALVIGQRFGRRSRPHCRQLVGLGVLMALGAGWLVRWPQSLVPRDNVFDGFLARNLTNLTENVPAGERVFVSGSLVFRLNEALETAQVRGGVDAGAVHPFWHHAAYQLREGAEGKLAYLWLRALGTGWVVVHQADSVDPYHDFRSPEKFSGEGFELVWKDQGDGLYRVAETGLARVVTDPEAFFSLPAPAGGDDAVFLAKYNALVNSLIPLSWQNINHFSVSVPPAAAAVSLAVSYDPGWRAVQEGRRLPLRADALGQLSFVPEKEGLVDVRYAPPPFDQALGVTVSIMVWLGVFGRFGKIGAGLRSSTDRAAAS